VQFAFGPLNFLGHLSSDARLLVAQQVSNPSIQFMIYETLLKKLTEKRAINERGLKHVAATEVILLVPSSDLFYQLAVKQTLLRLCNVP
jgi:hypothetical protein